jgi:hypothetical protein
MAAGQFLCDCSGPQCHIRPGEALFHLVKRRVGVVCVIVALPPSPRCTTSFHSEQSGNKRKRGPSLQLRKVLAAACVCPHVRYYIQQFVQAVPWIAQVEADSPHLWECEQNRHMAHEHS